jgi:hypothetical protein
MRIQWVLAAAAALQTAAATGSIHFTNVGSATNTLVRCNTHGSGFFDVDADGYDDIFVVQNTSIGEYTHLPNTFLKNLTYGMFQNNTNAAGVQGYLDVSAQGMAAADEVPLVSLQWRPSTQFLHRTRMPLHPYGLPGQMNNRSPGCYFQGIQTHAPERLRY